MTFGSNKFLWVGLTFILAIVPALAAFGIHASDVIVLVGAILMLIGAVLLVMDR